MDFSQFNWGSLIGGLGQLLGGFQQSEGYDEAEKFYKEAGRITKLSGAIRGTQIQRGIWQTQGTARANASAGGLTLGGSVSDVIRSNTQQGYLTKAVNALNTNLEYKSYMAQAAQMHSLSESSKLGGIFGGIGGLLGFF